MNDETRDERLRRILRAADPVAGDAGLTADEMREMRRTVLTAAAEPRRSFVLSPALAGAVIAALAAIAVLTLWPERDRPPAPPREPARVATMAPAPQRAAAPAAEASKSVPVAASSAARAAGESGAHRRHRATLAMPRKEIAIAGGTAPANEEELRTRQIQFATPGGTRVIWILTSDKAL